MLASDVVTRVQAILNDAGVQWVTADLLRWLNDGEREVMKVRPDAGLTATGIVLRPTADLAALTDTLTVGDDFRGMLVDWVCYRAFLENSENTENAKRATAHMQLFNAGNT